MSRNSARLGTVAATWTWPPEAVVALEQDHLVAPLGGGDRRLQPAGAAADHDHPCGAGAGAGTGVDSRPVRGFSMQPSQRLRPIRPTHSWLHDRQVRMSVACPDRALAAKSASAIWPRTTPTRSQTPVVQGPVGLERVLEPAHPDHRQADRVRGWRSG